VSWTWVTAIGVQPYLLVLICNSPSGIYHFLSFFLYYFLFFAVLGFELKAYTLSHSISPFCVKYFEIGSHKLFAWAGFETQPS
jgi:hypothetical protein